MIEGHSRGSEMSDQMLVTGATGLTGATIAIMAASRGKRVRALARSEEGLEPLTKSGVEIVLGDVRDPASLDKAMTGVDAVLHSAAVLGGTWSTVLKEEFWDVNHIGALNVLDAAKRAGVRRTVALDTVAIFDPAFTLTERSPVTLLSEFDSEYVKAKRAAFYGAMHRVCLGHDICFVTPGAIYGPGPVVERAMVPSSYSSIMARGVTGEIASYLNFPLQFTYVKDLAEVSLRALSHGKTGHRYLGFSNESVSSIPAFLNRAAEFAGSPHRVKDVDPKDPDAPNIGTMRQFAERVYATPSVDSSATETALDFKFTARDEAIKETIAWLRNLGKLPEKIVA
jgi:nucleoside-diphosphate-sugar epimerase